MYSTIIELSSTPIVEEDRASHEELPDWFRGDVADYTEDADDRALSLRSLAESLDEIADFNLEANCLTLRSDAKERYFRGAYRSFKNILSKLESVSAKEFAGLDRPRPNSESFSYLLYRLRNCVEDKFGTYIYANEELVTLNEWLRYAADGVSYYIGGVMAYHY